MNTRAYVIECAVIQEKTVTNYLATLLDIKIETSVLLGIKSGALSFDTKIGLLIETGHIKKEDKKKFQAFAEIRNKFAHVLDAHDFTSCFALIDNIVGRLEKFYDEKIDVKVPEEERNRRLFVELNSDISAILEDVFERVVYKGIEKHLQDRGNVFVRCMMESMEEVKMKDSNSRSVINEVEKKLLEKMHSSN